MDSSAELKCARPPGWLPELIRLEAFGGDAMAWLSAVYAAFCRDFVASQPRLAEKRVGVNRAKDADGREVSFWHLATEGAGEAERTPDLRRCERIAWPRALVEALEETHPDVVAWRQERSGRPNLVIGLDDFSYVVVLRERPTHYLLVTAFCVERSGRRRTYRREWEKEPR